MRADLTDEGVDARLESFQGHSSFAWPLGAIALTGVLPAVIPRRRRLLRAIVGLASLVGAVTEGGLVRSLPPPSELLSRSRSQNVVAEIAPRGPERRTLCLVCHLDTSRGGLMFHPAVSRHVNSFFGALGAACAVQAAEPILGLTRAGRGPVTLARTVLLAGLVLLVEREIRGEDAPGANDNASGAAVAAELALECAAEPLESTRVVLLMTGCEESGLMGSRAFLRARDTTGWLFVNFDSVGGPATLRYALREGVQGMLLDADEGLIQLADRIAADRPDLGMKPAEKPIGLTYDTTPILADGGRGITFIAGNGTIPNYHWPTDTPENIDPETLRRAFEAGREMVAAIDRGEAD
jgi:hypothetical protein